jgi:mono/diheme cytochrome c family protein
MRHTFQAAFLLVLGLAAASCSKNGSTSGAGASADSAAQAAAAMTPVQRGQYLVTVIGCGDCHTPGTLYGAPDMTRQLSGSELGWQGPWGVSYARNLTPDSTGLAAWTDEEIIRALQNGVKRDGSPIAPPMPWPDFAHLTRADAEAVVAYLRSLPPVHHVVPDRVPPGAKATGSIIAIPPAPAWDKGQKPAS